MDHRIRGSLLDADHPDTGSFFHADPQQGFGVALVPECMARECLLAGRLVKLTMTAIPMKHDYLIAHPKRLEASHTIQAVIEALKA